jgi:hypothetical protein
VSQQRKLAPRDFQVYRVHFEQNIIIVIIIITLAVVVLVRIVIESRRSRRLRRSRRRHCLFLFFFFLTAFFFRFSERTERKMFRVLNPNKRFCALSLLLSSIVSSPALLKRAFYYTHTHTHTK